MKFIITSAIILSLMCSIKCDNSDVMMSILAQFLTSSSPSLSSARSFERTTEAPNNLFPKVLNPLNWIPKIPDTTPYNPDSELSTPEIITRHGYPAETHTIKTDDGYLLNLHRIPCGRAGCNMTIRQPIFLQHGILASSADWVLSGPEKGIAFILADLGYDVWLSNLRGNTYSRHHVTFSTNDKEFWDFSFHGRTYIHKYLMRK